MSTLLPRSTITLDEFCRQTSFTPDSVGVHSFHNMLEPTGRQEECSGSYSERSGLRAAVCDVELIPCLNLPRIGFS